MHITQRIEEVREELIELVMAKGLQDPQVIAASEKIDKLIAEYYRLIQGNQK